MLTALSFRQPWAWVTIHLGKTLDNRRWETDFRGEFLIYASKSMTKADYYGCMDTCRDILGTSVLSKFPPLKALPRGGIVGAARLASVLPRCPTWPCEHPWHMPDPDCPPKTQFGFMLERVRPSPRFVPCDGPRFVSRDVTIGFFNVSPAVAAALRP